jgi:hypothetical protein
LPSSWTGRRWAGGCDKFHMRSRGWRDLQHRVGRRSAHIVLTLETTATEGKSDKSGLPNLRGSLFFRDEA